MSTDLSLYDTYVLRMSRRAKSGCIRPGRKRKDTDTLSTTPLTVRTNAMPFNGCFGCLFSEKVSGRKITFALVLATAVWCIDLSHFVCVLMELFNAYKESIEVSL